METPPPNQYSLNKIILSSKLTGSGAQHQVHCTELTLTYDRNFLIDSLPKAFVFQESSGICVQVICLVKTAGLECSDKLCKAVMKRLRNGVAVAGNQFCAFV